MSAPTRYRFADFTLELDPVQLLQGTAPVALQAKPLALLTALVEAEGVLVSKDALMDRAWPDVLVSEASLSQAVRKVRKALQSAGAAGDAIETRPGLGYRFALPVTAERDTPRASGNLGADPGGMVGRKQEQDAVVELLQQHRLVSIVGPGGIGKTTLARAVARRLDPSTEAGSWWVPVEAEQDAAGLLARVAGELGVDLRQGGAARLEAALAARGSLVLVLDNMEQLADPSALLLGWLQAAPALRILVTSRTRLHLRAERVFELQPLPLEAAVALFQLRAGDTSDAAEDLGPLLQRVDRIPLAVELLAAQRLLLPVAQLQAAVDAGLSDLPNLHVDAPARHQTLRVAMEWSWSLLSPADQGVLEALSVFSESFTAARALAVVGAPSLPALHRLRAASLIHMEAGGELRLLVPIRELARERLRASGRHGAVVCSLVQELARYARRERQLAMAELVRLRADLWSTIAHPAPPADRLACARLLVLLDGHRRDYAALAPLRACLAELGEAEEPLVAAWACALRARLASDHRQAAEARAHLARARVLAPEDGHVLLVAATLAGREGQHAQAIALAQAAEERFTAAGDPVEAALAQGNRGTTLIRAGRDREALDVLEAAVVRLEACGAARSSVPFALNLVVACGNLGRVQDRARWLEQLDAQLDREPDPYDRANVDFEWGRHLAGQGSLRPAAALLARAAEALRRNGASPWYVDWALALAQARLGQAAAARQSLERARRGARGAGPMAEADVHRATCIALALEGQPAEALEQAEAAVALYTAHGQLAGAAELRAWVALLLLLTGRGDEVDALPWSDAPAPTATLQAVGPLLRALGTGAAVQPEQARALAASAHDEDAVLMGILVDYIEKLG